jgi:hypothetical protein
MLNLIGVDETSGSGARRGPLPIPQGRFSRQTPGVAEPTAGGFPAISAPIGLLKDLVLLAVSIALLRTALASWETARR